MISEDLEQRFDRATEVLDENLKHYADMLGSLSVLSGTPYVHFMLSIMGGIRRVISDDPPPRNIYYEIDHDAATYLGGASQFHAEAAEIVREICATNIAAGVQIPEALRPHAAGLVRGNSNSANRRGPKTDDRFPLRYLAYTGALLVRDAFDLDIARSDGGLEMSACDAVSMVAVQHGVELKYTTVRDWCQSPKYAVFRKQADGLQAHLHDLLLIEIGLLKRDSVYGPFHGTFRMMGAA